MKILFHLNSMGRGGAERVVSILSDAFCGMGHDVVIATEWYSSGEYPVPDTVRRIHAGPDTEGAGRLRQIVQRYTRLRGVVLQEKPDVVISFCNKANFRSSAALIGTDIPLIVSVRNDPAVDYAPYRVSTAIMKARADGCVFQTPDAKAYFGEKFGAHPRIIMNPLSPQFAQEKGFVYSPQPSEGIGDPGQMRRRIVSVGRITPQKNQKMLLQAFAEASRSATDTELLLYGEVQEKEYSEELIRLAQELGVESRVHFMGATDKVADELKKAYLFVLSSDYEGMPNALLEAMSLGLPCVATDCPCGGSAMLTEHGEAGLLVPPKDAHAMAQAISTLVSDPGKAVRIGQKALQIRKKALPQNVAGEWMDYITEVIARKKAGRQ